MQVLVKNLNSGYLVRRIGKVRDVVTVVAKGHYCASCYNLIPKGDKCIRVEKKRNYPFHECLDCYPIKEVNMIVEDLKTSNNYGQPIKFKKLSESAVMPKYAKQGDAGLDLTATEIEIADDIWTYKTGLAVEIPEGYVGLLFPRSSIYKVSQRLTNSVGVIDSGYRGEIMLKFKIDDTRNGKVYEIGDRVGQLVIIQLPKFEPVLVEELSSTERGTGGYGSSGK